MKESSAPITDDEREDARRLLQRANTTSIIDNTQYLERLQTLNKATKHSELLPLIQDLPGSTEHGSTTWDASDLAADSSQDGTLAADSWESPRLEPVDDDSPSWKHTVFPILGVVAFFGVVIICCALGI